ncbi:MULTISPECIES: hypothetical protein [Bacillus]|uniref:Uncharacterized protein n=3 Tax=Bacillus thuringiensis TaxID=1428 RepID=A0A1W6WL53_BACTU|nr:MULTISPECIES: hypothetical protein [Bacillus]MEC2876658.1 hypothetical protein [Bacillus cereus]AEA15545.1 Phage protein [Bacillus thuringiensis serovar chinensis CT-43]AFV17672.1 phage protein [Bacillus thuringiensis Bt407]AGG00602.1 Phage protein [Bacillus thuringiensis serovar thuringiensis str. IS5056]ARP57286.1 hypothetical protein CAB88_09370 [Bacillus thuringiensis]
MRWQYDYLNDTPYLYSSKELRNMYKESRGKGEANSIVNHMERHEVFNNKEYRGYYSLSNDIIEDLYGEEEEILEWDEMVNQYQPILTSKGLQLKRKKDSI